MPLLNALCTAKYEEQLVLDRQEETSESTTQMFSLIIEMLFYLGSIQGQKEPSPANSPILSI